MKNRIAFLFLLLSLESNVFASIDSKLKKTTGNRPWIFFDLGDTVIDTHNRKELKFISGAYQYLLDLKASGHRLGIISNIPQKFGANYEEKLRTLKKFVSENWKGSEKFNWEIFDEIILPLNDSERKPSPVLFARARALAGSCPIIFMGENQKEIAMADSLGLSTFQVGQEKKSFYLSRSHMPGLIQKTYAPRFLTECFSR